MKKTTDIVLTAKPLALAIGIALASVSAQKVNAFEVTCPPSPPEECIAYIAATAAIAIFDLDQRNKDRKERRVGFEIPMAMGTTAVPKSLQTGGLTIKNMSVAVSVPARGQIKIDYHRDLVNDSRHRKFRSIAIISLLDKHGRVLMGISDKKYYTDHGTSRIGQSFSHTFNAVKKEVAAIRITEKTYRRSD